MRLGLAVLALTLLVQPPPAAPARSPARAAARDVAWLAGTWVSRSGTRVVEERWTPAEGGALFAISRTLNGGRLTGFEYLRIQERDGGIVYIAQPNGRPPTEFAATQVDDHSVTFENPAHDFPKMIRYERRPDGSLAASISGDGRTVSWTFATAPAGGRP
jgi:hypothetical protein